MDKLDFKPVELGDIKTIYEYTSKWGEGSCQHSPVSMYSLQEKYGDEFCIRNGVLYVLRKNLGDERYRVYLAPLGSGDLKKNFETIFEDAAAYGKKVKFISLTEEYANALKEYFGDDFEINEDRDIFEYMYSTERMSKFSGRSLKKRRSEVNTFWTRYKDRAEAKRISEEDIEDILEFESEWVKKNEETHDGIALNREKRMIFKQLSAYKELDLSGIVLRIDGKVRGFGYGTRLSDKFYDAIAEKGDRDVPFIYKVLRLESVKQCAMDQEFVNMEEDVGLEGLRALKYSYKPEYLLKKYTVVQKDGE